VSSVSLCMIVRDEAEWIEGALASARDAVEEAIVVDTGSRDRTPELAERAGARVVRAEWRDDFAAARNVGLERARGTHVLVLDADERLAPGAGEVLRRAADDPRFLAGLLPLSDADAVDAVPADVLAGARRLGEPCLVPRLFRSHPLVRYRGRVHETPLEGFEALRAAEGGEVRVLDAELVHYGAVPALRSARAKAERNRGLLERALAEERDPAAAGVLAGYLAQEYFHAGRIAAARAVAERHLDPLLAAIDALGARDEGALRPDVVRIAQTLALAELRAGDAAAALATARGALARSLRAHPNLRFLEGVALERLDRAAEAEHCFEDCLRAGGGAFEIPLNPGVTGAAARLRLANVRVALGRPEQAAELLPGVEPGYPVAAALVRAEVLLEVGRPAEALDAVAPALARAEPPPDLFALGFRATELLGGPDESLRAAARAAPAADWLEPRRRSLVPPRAGEGDGGREPRAPAR